MMTKPWWELRPERLEWEFESLRSKNYKYSEIRRDSTTGTLELEIEYPSIPEPIKLKVTFPPFFPHVRVDVVSADLNLDHHQNPYTGLLCLLERSSVLWDPSQSVASFLEERMPLLLEAGATSDVQIASQLEELQAEPGTVYLPYDLNSIIFIPEELEASDSNSGNFRLLLQVGESPNSEMQVKVGVKGFVTEADGKSLRQPLPQILKDWQFTEDYGARWFELSKYTKGISAAEFIREATTEHPSLEKLPVHSLVKNRRVELVAFLVPDEHAHRTLGKSWIFALRVFTPGKGGRDKPKLEATFVRATKFGTAVLQKRAPEVARLASKKVVIFGLGCIGAPSAIEFAKATIGELRFADDDIVELGPTVRWPLGVPYVGHPKVNVLAHFIRTNWPTTVSSLGVAARIGGSEGQSGIPLNLAKDLFTDVDLIYDSTAEPGISSLLAQISLELNIPHIAISATSGGYGGIVVAAEPDRTGCYDCFLRYVEEGLIQMPPESQDGKVNIEGCASPTFTATSFDTSEIALAGVRAAVSLLLKGEEGGYPKMQGDIGVLRLRDKNGSVIFPEWTTYSLDIHPECPNHPALLG